MGWAGWASVGLAALTSIILIAVHWGYFKKQIESILKTLEKHERHIMDTDIHWTARERDALVAQLERLSASNKRTEELIQESLTERADVVKVITALMERKNGPKKV